MASEWWGPPSDLGFRLRWCGHAVRDRDDVETHIEDGQPTINCPECNFPEPFAPASRCRDGVPTVELQWNAAQCKSRRRLKALRQYKGRPKTLEALLSAMSKSIVPTIDLEGTTVKLGQRLRERDSTEGLVLRAWPAGCTVTSGTVILPRAAVVLLTGPGACFEAIEFTGRGLIVCCGADCHINFRGCLFSQCTLYVVHGAAVDLRRCTFSEAPHGLVAHGDATHATLTGCTFDGCTIAVIAERGATVTQSHCTTRRGRSAIIAHDNGTRVTCMDSTYAGVPKSLEKMDVAGVTVSDAHVALRRCFVERFVQGVNANGGSARAEVHDSVVRASGHTILAIGGAAVTLRNADIQVRCRYAPRRMTSTADGSVSAPSLVQARRSWDGRAAGCVQIGACALSGLEGAEEGIIVRDCGMVSLARSQVACANVCLAVSGGARATAAHSTLRSESETACCAMEAGSVFRVCGGRVSGRLGAVTSADHGVLTASGATLGGLADTKAPAHSAVHVVQGGVARLSECLLQHTERGVDVEDGEVTAHSVTIQGMGPGDSGTQLVGYILTGGRLAAKGGAVTGFAFGASMPERQRGQGTAPAHASFDGVSFEENGHGVMADDGASLALADCVFSTSLGLAPRRGLTLSGLESPREPEDVPGVAVLVSEAAGAASVTGCTFRGYDHAVQGQRPDGVDVSGCTFIGGGVQLFARGSVRDCEFSDTECAVAVAAPECAVRGCRFGPGVATGVMGYKSGEVAVSACHFEACDVAVRSESRAVVDIDDTEVSGGHTAVHVTDEGSVRARRLTVRRAGTAFKVGSEESTGAKARLDECVLADAELGGVVVRGVGAQAMLDQCVLTRCQAGVMARSGAVGNVSNTNFVDCHEAVVLGEDGRALERECRVCGREGSAAVAAAWEALRADGGAGVPGARCEHDGLYALATLRHIRIRGCHVGVSVCVTGRADCEHVAVHAAAESFMVDRIGAASRFAECTATGGRGPAVTSRRLKVPGSEVFCEYDAVPGVAVVDEGRTGRG